MKTCNIFLYSGEAKSISTYYSTPTITPASPRPRFSPRLVLSAQAAFSILYCRLVALLCEMSKIIIEKGKTEQQICSKTKRGFNNEYKIL